MHYIVTVAIYNILYIINCQRFLIQNKQGRAEIVSTVRSPTRLRFHVDVANFRCYISLARTLANTFVSSATNLDTTNYKYIYWIIHTQTWACCMYECVSASISYVLCEMHIRSLYVLYIYNIYVCTHICICYKHYTIL